MRFKQLIVEARFDKQTTQISRAIVNQYKKILDTLEADSADGEFEIITVPPDLFDLQPKAFGLEEMLDEIRVELRFTSYGDDVRLAGAYYHGRAIMVIEIDIPEHYRDRRYIGRWLPELKGTIRHELEHVLQDFRGELDDLDPDPDSLDGFLDYWYDPVELNAFAAEIYKQAKTRREPASKLVDEYIDKFRQEAEDWVYFGELSASELERHSDNLRRTMTTILSRRYPAAQLENHSRKLRLVLQKVLTRSIINS
jgi:hypothetical protein